MYSSQNRKTFCWKKICIEENNKASTRLLGRPTTAYVSTCSQKIPMRAFLEDF
jgi:hypothetical protein